MPDPGLLRPPATVLFGAGAAQQVAALAAEHGERVLLCSDGFLLAGVHGRRLQASLRAAGVELSVWDATVPELPLDAVLEAIAFGRRARPACVVGFGGGSSIDLAKLVALGITLDVTDADELRALYGEDQVPRPIVPLVAVPTTAGTGSEVTPVAVLTDPERALKVGIASRRLIPVAAVCDPLLTAGCPPRLTAHAGMDALAHAIEAFTARRFEPGASATARVFVGKNLLSDAYALTAMEQIAPHLPAALDDDPAARTALAYGSLAAGLAFATAGTAAAHALQYPIGARTETAHGLGTGLLLSHVMAFNRPARVPELAQAARAMGFAAPGDDDERAADHAIAGVRELALRAGLPGGLSDLGLPAGELPDVAEQAIGISRLVDNNPRQLDRAGALAILESAWPARAPSSTRDTTPP